MKRFKSITIFGLIFIFGTGISEILQAQDGQDPRRDAIQAYNNARELAESEQYLDAIELYRAALEIAEENEFEDVIELVTGQIPRVYLTRAVAEVNRFQRSLSLEDVNRAIEYLEEAADIGEEFGDTTVRDQATRIVPRLYYNRSLIEFNRGEGDHEAALESLARARELNPNYTLAYYQAGIVIRDLDDTRYEESVEWYDRAIEVGERIGDTENVQRAKTAARALLVYWGVEKMNNDELNVALEHYNRAAQYEPNHVDVNFRLAEVYNKMENWDRAIEFALKALENEPGGVTDRAKHYYELGIAYQEKEMKEQACEAFENAAYGDLRDSALHKLEHELECEGYTNATRR